MSVPAKLIEPPDYRAFELMDELPRGCIPFPVTDGRGWPHLRLGEFAVVDTNDREPRSGDVYLVEWDGGGRDLVSIKAFPNECVGASPEKPHEWWIGAPAYPWARRGARRLSLSELLLLASRYGTNDGPITNRDYLRSKLVGRVIGILGSAPEGPMRVVGGGGNERD